MCLSPKWHMGGGGRGRDAWQQGPCRTDPFPPHLPPVSPSVVFLQMSVAKAAEMLCTSSQSVIATVLLASRGRAHLLGVLKLSR